MPLTFKDFFLDKMRDEGLHSIRYTDLFNFKINNFIQAARYLNRIPGQFLLACFSEAKKRHLIGFFELMIDKTLLSAQNQALLCNFCL